VTFVGCTGVGSFSDLWVVLGLVRLVTFMGWTGVGPFSDSYGVDDY
jgi:hypothetical protein